MGISKKAAQKVLQTEIDWCKEDAQKPNGLSHQHDPIYIKGFINGLRQAKLLVSHTR